MRGGGEKGGGDGEEGRGGRPGSDSGSHPIAEHPPFHEAQYGQDGRMWFLCARPACPQQPDRGARIRHARRGCAGRATREGVQTGSGNPLRPGPAAAGLSGSKNLNNKADYHGKSSVHDSKSLARLALEASRVHWAIPGAAGGRSGGRNPKAMRRVWACIEARRTINNNNNCRWQSIFKLLARVDRLQHRLHLRTLACRRTR